MGNPTFAEVRAQCRSFLIATLAAMGLMTALGWLSGCTGEPIEPVDAGPEAAIDGYLPGVDAGADTSADATAPDPDPIDIECDADGLCAGGVCEAGLCLPSICGDLVVDPRSGEECEDGNDEPRDGCEPITCRFTRCESDEECSDREPCNGAERCELSTGQCLAGAPLAGDTECVSDSVAEGTCRDVEGEMTCVLLACGNGILDVDEDCDDGDLDELDGCRSTCRFTCILDVQCGDRDLCDGNETCDLETHRCVAGSALDCSDLSPCTMDTCIARFGCVNTPIDADGDGHSPSSLGLCGDDCDDSRDDVHPEMEELCDGLDHDCDGDASSETPPSWYLDCDGDGHAPIEVLDSDTSVRVSCTEPSPLGACGWTTRRPRESRADCDDGADELHPGATEIAGDEIDQNCDGEERCYVDADNDDHRTASGSTRASDDTDCRDAMEARVSAPADDCCDTDGDVYPGQTEFFYAESSCGSFDYDCSFGFTREFPSTNVVEACSEREVGFDGSGADLCAGDGLAGWLNARPACGARGDWQPPCEAVFDVGERSCERTRPLDERHQGCR